MSKLIFLFLFFPAIAFSGPASDPPLNGEIIAISPNHHWMARVEHLSSQNIPEKCQDLDEAVDQVVLYDVESLNQSVLVRPNFECDDPKERIVSIEQIQFSRDSKTLYFQVPAWPVSGALHAINIDGSHLQYIAPSNHFSLIEEGSYAGDLVLAQHRYFIPAGSYDASWVYSPEGEELGLMNSGENQPWDS